MSLPFSLSKSDTKSLTMNAISGINFYDNITATINQNSSSTVTGLSLQSILGVGNNPTWTAKIYGYS